MTNEEAIAVLESDVEYMYSQDYPYNREAYRMAIEALKAEPVNLEKLSQAYEIIAAHEQIAYDQGCRDGYARAMAEQWGERREDEL